MILLKVACPADLQRQTLGLPSYYNLINSILFREIINEELSKENIIKFEWIILSINELEAFQAHIKAGQSLSSIINKLKTENYNAVLEELNQFSPKTYRDCCLYQIQNEMYKRIGV